MRYVLKLEPRFFSGSPAVGFRNSTSKGKSKAWFESCMAEVLLDGVPCVVQDGSELTSGGSGRVPRVFTMQG